MVTDYLGSERDGGFAELVVVPAGNAHAVVGNALSDVELASPPTAATTAMRMLPTSPAPPTGQRASRAPRRRRW